MLYRPLIMYTNTISQTHLAPLTLLKVAKQSEEEESLEAVKAPCSKLTAEELADAPKTQVHLAFHRMINLLSKTLRIKGQQLIGR